MIQPKFLICVLLIFLNSHLLAELNLLDFSSTRSSLKAISVFEGDQYGDFKNDLVAFLNDGSAWKVHPKDLEKFSFWALDDFIHIQVRTSFYWFKREHKFELVNDSRKESVRAMLVQYPVNALVVEENEKYLASYRMKFYTTRDAHGNLQYHYSPIYTYKTKLRLNDGSIYITAANHHYSNGDKVYCFLDHEDQLAFILVKGIEREATWHKVSKESN